MSNNIPTFIDSGASSSCIRNKERFITYTAVRVTGRMATEGHNGSFQIEGYGVAEIMIRTKEGRMNCLRIPASHTPSFSMNLLSLPRMDKKGFHGTWGEGRIEVRDPRSGKLIVDGVLAGSKHGLYQVEVVDTKDNLTSTHRDSTTPKEIALASSSRSQPCSLSMWHMRFGHADINLIRIMAQRKIVDGLDVTDYTLCGKCEVCVYSKAKRMPFDDIVVPSSEPLDCVSLDLWGPSRVKSLGGAVYMMLACNDGTGIPFPYFSSNKEAATILQQVKRFKVMAELQTGHRIQVFRIDMGKEFEIRTFDDWCAECGIIAEKVPKSSSSANGQVK
jgi:hypothetical protein